MKSTETKLNLDQLNRIYSKYSIKMPPFCLFGIRDESNQNDDEFNDILGCIFNGTIYLSQGTTDPGWQATNGQAGGAAHLCLGWHPDIWSVGMHPRTETPLNKNFRHEAFVQTGSARIWRDLNRNGVWEKSDPTQVGYFGINRHRASIAGSEHIGPYGAGCQVHAKPESLLRELRFAKESGSKSFGYLLIDKSEVV